MEILKKIHREIISLSPEDSFLVLEKTKNLFNYPIHYHPQFELNFISGGKGVRRTVGESMEEIDDLELVLIGPNLFHIWEWHVCTEKNIKEVTIHFDKDLFVDSFLKRNIMKPIKDMFARASHGISFSRSTIENVAPRISKVAKLDGMDYFIELLSILYDLAISRNQKMLSTSRMSLENFENDDRIMLFYDYVQKNYASKITLGEVSNLLNMSNVSFNRFIKRRSGKTFVEYLNDVRISNASKLLIEKDLSVSEIAFMCGFNSIANFNRVFLRKKGQTPTRFRQDFSGIKRVL